ncbi:3-hydroxyacyl-CoA dehydrogenase family protein [Serratia ficaria]|nr:3-hydroxyacyl-CoA dehydrogenase NAD-binding domain-containing protein [Serratia ficaria]CAI1219513.1 Probable 3-hydroxybutyryl-CoA dehydrogenase [Serratia ficaria]CAI1219947.1 Probable 3-hydroxybutyryl-CoA dehydrogenase [Serratia ficaria]CAI2031816.1 Probable 3-hydroxybutyryl-CoA dehydrogenase [Serratia ficaria]CAI2526788.1 Probable 3-hydroxybutyryl-CoA dehydrogenase [Serratia ficaria]CAI2531388.1 Probable 3-hydroxybutyryl-CoA dehydrogenase [Serratia ficaria]
MNHPVTQVTIIGGGLMGSGIAQIFAARGVNVTIYDIDARIYKAPETIRVNLQRMQTDEGSIQEILARISFCDELSAGVAGAQIVFECVPERLALKQQLFKELDTLCPEETILASNTSVISISEIARDVRHKQRVLGTHFWNPAFLIPLVEVIRTQWTEDAVFERTASILAWAGKRPVRVNKDIPGFLVNRLQHALWREAIYLVEEGIADARTVDEGIRFGFGLRLPTLGPLENADMVGTDLTLAIHEYIFPHLNNATTPSPLLRRLVAEGKLGFKSGEGFQSWDDASINASRERLLNYLQHVTLSPEE